MITKAAKTALIAVLLTACLDAPSTSTDEQANCTQDPFAPEANTIGCRQHCTALDSCTDANLQSGTCCAHFGTPAPAPIHSVQCGNELDGTPTCIGTNRYFDGTLVQIECTTVTQWFVVNGQVESQSTTDCHYY